MIFSLHVPGFEGVLYGGFVASTESRASRIPVHKSMVPALKPAYRIASAFIKAISFYQGTLSRQRMTAETCGFIERLMIQSSRLPAFGTDEFVD